MAVFTEALSDARLFHLRYNNIGIKLDFLCINICWAPIVVQKPERVKQGF